MKNHHKKTAAVLFWILVWYIIAAVLSKPLILPYPHEVLMTLLSLIPEKEFLCSVGVSVARMTAGIALGTVAGCVLGWATYKSEIIRIIFSPLISVIRSTPVASFIVIFLLWIGRDILPGVISLLVVIPIVWSNIYAGLSDQNEDILEMAEVFRISAVKKLTRITIPSIRPYFLSSLRTAIGMGWKSGVAAEVLTLPKNSIGSHIYEAKLYMETADLFAWTIFVIIVSVLAENILFLLIKGKGNDS